METSNTSRLHALTDGVFAIVMTLLVLELAVPVLAYSSSAELNKHLIDMWPEYFSYVVSFVYLGLFWLSHAELFTRITYADGRTFMLNLAYLLIISLLPFSASLASKYWRYPASALVYGLNLLIPVLLNFWMLNCGLKSDKEQNRTYLRNERIATIVIAAIIIVALGIAFVKAPFSFLLFGAMPLFYIAAIWKGKEGLAVRTPS